MTPLQIVKDKYGSKDKLVDAVAKLVEPAQDESADDHKRRLRNVPNAKLLHLVDLGERVDKLGGRDKIVTKILELKNQPKDNEYRDHLAKVPLGRLVDMVGALERRTAGKAKKKARPQRKRKKS